MPRLYFSLRLLAVVAVFPAIALYIVGAAMLQVFRSLGHGWGACRVGSFKVALRIWLSVLDWTKGIPVGYSYWVQYEAPLMLDAIEVHHDE